jgi:hypothetical protein
MIGLWETWYVFPRTTDVISHRFLSYEQTTWEVNLYCQWSPYLDHLARSTYYIAEWFSPVQAIDSKESTIDTMSFYVSSVVLTWLMSVILLRNSVHNWSNWACRLAVIRSVRFPWAASAVWSRKEGEYSRKAWPMDRHRPCSRSSGRLKTSRFSSSSSCCCSFCRRRRSSWNLNDSIWYVHEQRWDRDSIQQSEWTDIRVIAKWQACHPLPLLGI